jgi:transcriptional regulator with XRE-family HTH domain
LDEDFAAAFGAVLRSIRNDRGLSQEELAFKADIHRNYVGLLERGVRQPSLATIFYIADALNLPASDLVAKVDIYRKQNFSQSG